ncbi:MAG: LuxR C-terminal-related transcriptional regulator [Treponema sp.]|nr:LuxR C-terminal-related transcriptional regulator [Treponema sp.]
MKKDNDYIHPHQAEELLKKARHLLQPAYIFGMTTYGKSELIKQSFLGHRYVYFSSENGDYKDSSVNLEKRLISGRKTPYPVVFDDLQNLTDPDIQAKILKIANMDVVWPVFISRAPLLGWLIPFYTRRNFTIIGEKELSISDLQIRDYFYQRNIIVSDADITNLQKLILGNPFIVKFAANCLEKNPSIPELFIEIEQAISIDMTANTIKAWPEDFRNFFLTLSIVDTFTEDFAAFITGCDFTSAYIAKARSLGNFLIKNEGAFSFRPIPLKGFRHNAKILFGEKKLNEIYIKAADWFNERNQLDKALALYKKAASTEKIRQVLIKNSYQNPENGLFLSLSSYYFDLSKEEIESEAILMCGMSMISSMLFKIEESEYWYQDLKAHLSTYSREKELEANIMLDYLDIALPHRPISNILEKLKEISGKLTSKSLKLPDFSMTSNLPSLLNGGKDFTDWILIKNKMDEEYFYLVELALGKCGKGYVALLKAEFYYEMAVNEEDCLSLISRGQMEAELCNNMSMEFVAIALLIHFYLAGGNIDSAITLYAAFEQKCYKNNIKKMEGNLRALQCRIDLYRGDVNSIKLWLEKYAPDENNGFYGFLRYQYMTKIRCYICFGKNQEALALKEKVKLYAENYNRKYIDLECRLLTAIINFRLKNSDSWKKIIISVLKEAEKYNFIRIISKEAAAILPLLKTLSASQMEEEGINKNFFRKVLRETSKMTNFYPNYCNFTVTGREGFSQNARMILRLQSQGLQAKDIARELNLNEENVRYHIKKNYKKLGVNSKTEAIKIAKELFLI